MPTCLTSGICNISRSNRNSTHQLEVHSNIHSCGYKGQYGCPRLRCWPLYPHEWIFEWTSSCRVLFLLLRDMLQRPEVRFTCIPVDQQFVHYASYLVTGFVLFFSFSWCGIPVIKSHCVWPDDDGYRNTERAREYLSIVGGANPNLELSSYLTHFSMNP